MFRHKSVVAGIATAMLAGVAAAAPTVRFNDTESNFNGNDGFQTDLGADGSYDYVTFCVETQETFTYGVVYEYATSSTVKQTGGGGPFNFDTAAGHAIAYIFTAFQASGEAAIQSISGINGLTNSQYRELFQRMIWNKLYGGSTTGTFTQAMIDQLYGAAEGVWSDLGNIRVMNVWDDAETENGAHEDMLVIVPLPSGAGLASLGLLGLAGAARRRRN